MVCSSHRSEVAPCSASKRHQSSPRDPASSSPKLGELAQDRCADEPRGLEAEALRQIVAARDASHGGLVVWIIYLAADKDVLAWIAFAMLVVVALLGWTMFAIWFRRRQARAGAVDVASPGVPAEQHFPVAVVTLHGVLAVTTVVLVLLTGLGVGGS